MTGAVTLTIIFDMLSGDALERLAQAIANETVGDGAVEKLEVEVGEDADGRPTYIFSFLIDEARARTRMGLLHIRLVQSLRDALISKSDAHYPVVRLLDRKDWASRIAA